MGGANVEDSLDYLQTQLVSVFICCLYFIPAVYSIHLLIFGCFYGYPVIAPPRLLPPGHRPLGQRPLCLALVLLLLHYCTICTMYIINLTTRLLVDICSGLDWEKQRNNIFNFYDSRMQVLLRK